MTLLQRLASNALYRFSYQALLLGLAFASSPYIVHHLGVDLYGVLLLVGLTTNYFAAAELGLGQASIKFIADTHARQDWNGLSRVFWTAVITYLAISTIAALVLMAVTPWLVHLLRVPTASVAITEQVLYLAAMGLIVSMMSSIVSSVPRALERFDLFSFVGIVVGIGQVTTNVLLLHFGYSLRAMIMAGMSIQVIVLVVYAHMVKKLLPRIGKPQWDRSSLRQLLDFGTWVTVSQGVGPILAHIEKFILGSLSTIAAVTFYTVPYNLSSSVNAIPAAISTVLFPAFSRLAAEQDARRTTDLLLRSTKYLFMGVLPLAVVLAVFSRNFLDAWMGAEFAAHSAIVLRILVSAAVIYAVSVPSCQVLQALGRPDVPAKFQLFEVCIHVPLCFFLIKRYGIVGAGVAWAVRVLLDTLLLTVSCSRVMGLAYHAFLYRTLFRTGMAAVCLSPAILLAKWWLHDLNRFMTLLCLTVLAFSYSIGVVALSLDDTDKRHLLPLVRDLMKRLSLSPIAVCPPGIA